MRTLNALLLCVIASILFAGCGGGAPTEPEDFEFGRADVYVRNEAGAPIDGAAVSLVKPNGQVDDTGGLTGGAGIPGYYFFLRTTGDFKIVVSPPSGYEFVPGQSGSVPFTFHRNQTQTVNFVVRHT
jgi:hypothetical protein